ncbi:MAG: hypothetical protein ACKPKO_61675, partial [Candidatus Fonsibacter sp.]
LRRVRVFGYCDFLWDNVLLISRIFGQNKPFCLNMDSEGKATNLWHHTDYGQHCKLHYFWDQLIKNLTYLCVANSWGDRSRLRMTQDVVSTWQAPSTTTFSSG